MKQFLFGVVALLYLGLCGANSHALEGGTGHPGIQISKEARVAPEILLKDAEGNLSGSNNHKGKVILVHFWATWCEPCKDEIPTINALWERFRDREFAVIAIAEDSNKAVKPYIKEHGVKFPVLIDQYGKAFRSYGVRAFPTSYIVNKSGRIEGIALGQRDWTAPEIVNFIEGLLKE